MATKPISFYFAPALLVLGTALAAADWALRPERAPAWGAALLLLGCMSLVLRRVRRRAGNEGGQNLAADSIGTGIVFAGLILVSALGLKLAATLGVIHDAEVSDRTIMVIMGAFFVFTGNAMPKVLTPLSARRGDAASAQAYRRVGGWIWVLTGLAFTIAWLGLPIGVAEPASLLVVGSGLLVQAGYAIRSRRTC